MPPGKPQGLVPPVLLVVHDGGQHARGEVQALGGPADGFAVGEDVLQGQRQVAGVGGLPPLEGPEGLEPAPRGGQRRFGVVEGRGAAVALVVELQAQQAADGLGARAARQDLGGGLEGQELLHDGFPAGGLEVGQHLAQGQLLLGFDERQGASLAQQQQQHQQNRTHDWGAEVDGAGPGPGQRMRPHGSGA